MSKRKFSTTTCLFCRSDEIDDLNYGEFIVKSKFAAHYFCILVSTNLAQNGKDSQGIYGFLIPDIIKFYDSVRNKKCKYCNKYFANLVCAKGCGSSFHLPCGLKNGTQTEFSGSYKSYCHACRVKPRIPNIVYAGGTICALCRDDIVLEDDNIHDVYWPLCCHPPSLLHIRCLKQLAINSGYYTKCPMCANTTKFRKSIRKAGVYIPDRDASWMSPAGDYSGCDLPNCSYVVSHATEPWELVCCPLCNFSSAHVNCLNAPIYICTVCQRDSNRATVLITRDKAVDEFFNKFSTPLSRTSIEAASSNNNGMEEDTPNAHLSEEVIDRASDSSSEPNVKQLYKLQDGSSHFSNYVCKVF